MNTRTGSEQEELRAGPKGVKEPNAGSEMEAIVRGESSGKCQVGDPGKSKRRTLVHHEASAVAAASEVVVKAASNLSPHRICRAVLLQGSPP